MENQEVIKKDYSEIVFNSKNPHNINEELEKIFKEKGSIQVPVVIDKKEQSPMNVICAKLIGPISNPLIAFCISDEESKERNFYASLQKNCEESVEYIKEISKKISSDDEYKEMINNDIKLLELFFENNKEFGLRTIPKTIIQKIEEAASNSDYSNIALIIYDKIKENHLQFEKVGYYVIFPLYKLPMFPKNIAVTEKIFQYILEEFENLEYVVIRQDLNHFYNLQLVPKPNLFESGDLSVGEMMNDINKYVEKLGKCCRNYNHVLNHNTNDIKDPICNKFFFMIQYDLQMQLEEIYKS